MQSMKSDGLILPEAVIDRVIFVCLLCSLENSGHFCWSFSK